MHEREGGDDVSLPIYLSLSHTYAHITSLKAVIEKKSKVHVFSIFSKNPAMLTFMLGKWLKMHMAILFIKAN